LKENMFVLTCRMCECLAVAEHGNCLMSRVGRLTNPQDTEHMGTYVCEPASSEKKTWRALRLAKNSERLFTFAECFAAEQPHTQITRSGMVRLLEQISPGGSTPRAPRQPVLHLGRDPHPKLNPLVGERGWGTPTPIGRAARKENSIRVFVPEEEGAANQKK
jgi:hypothetical protein